jgi:ABC-2 type transport system permease protein/oleandomycin transport system permease protein
MTNDTETIHAEKGSLRWAISDVLTMARRNLLAIVRIPTALVFSFLQPIMFVLLFRYIFGAGAINVPIPGGYVNYLLPGIIVQTTIFGAVGTAIGLAEDLQHGLIERFRALPMSRMAVLAGRTVSDLGRNVVVLVIMTGVGIAVGFRPHGGVVNYILACLITLLFAYCLSWGFAFIGLAAPNSEAAQAMTFPLIFPLTFASGIFVQVSTMPGWLQPFATYQPVSEVAKAVRYLMNGPNVILPHPGNSVWIAIVWSVGLIAVLGPLATAKYKKVA